MEATIKPGIIPATKSRKSKQSSPVRLPEVLYKRVVAAARLNSRSVSKQLEHLMAIAESVSGMVSREELLEVQSGLSKIVIEKTEAPRVDKKSLFNSLETMRSSGALSKVVTPVETKYQASPKHPGYLERINENGSRETGMFKNGKFIVEKSLV